MPTNKILRTPIIKPRTQGGTFYTFSSAAEDIGLNIAEQRNKVALSHYVLLNLPAAEQAEGSSSQYPEGGNEGDYIYAENIQNYVLNMETVLRNQASYNFAANGTVSERVFWKWLRNVAGIQFKEQNGYYIEDASKGESVIQAYGRISASSQRSDDYSIYNETFVQIPSSYGKMDVLFYPHKDTNMTFRRYDATNEDGLIENITPDEVDDAGNIKVTGITATAQYDDDERYTSSYKVIDPEDVLQAEFNIDNLRAFYGDNELTIDDLGMGNYDGAPAKEDTDFDFNAVLIYYSIYDAASNKVLATNAYGILLLASCDTADKKIPTLHKVPSTGTASGTSYSFRLNIKTTSAYTGDITVIDNSTSAYAMSEDFNVVIRNLNESIEVLKSNAASLRNIVSDNQTIKNLAMAAMDKIEDLENTILTIKNGDETTDLLAGTVDAIDLHVSSANDEYEEIRKDEIQRGTMTSILSALKAMKTPDGKMSIKVSVPEDADVDVKDALESLISTNKDIEFNDITGIVTLLLYKMQCMDSEIKEFTKRV